MLIHRLLLIVFTVSAWCLIPGLTRAELTPRETAILVNSTSPSSVRLGDVYVHLRGVPASHIIRIPVDDKETVSRNDYDELIAKPVRRVLNDFYDKGTKIRCLITTYGIPLKISAVKPVIMPEDEIEKNSNTIKKKQKELDKLLNQKKESEVIDKKAEKNIRRLKKQIQNLKRMLENLKGADTASAVDSELALVLIGGYSIKGMVPNPLLLANRGKPSRHFGQILMVSRIDAPTPELAEGLIRTAVEVERTGPSGNVYLDARGLKGKGPYALFDQDIRRTAEILSPGFMPVFLDTRPELFGPGEAPAAALYCGWYSLGKYRDVFKWVKGAVGYHVASSEAVSLHNPKRTYWVKSMIERGVIASIGPVSEPYLSAFPVPSLFFPLLMSGKYTLAEVFAMTNPFLSWRMILVGDPLYNPFKRHPAYQADNLPAPP
jgi:uncharacterized protein (TIGR03790 family)